MKDKYYRLFTAAVRFGTINLESLPCQRINAAKCSNPLRKGTVLPWQMPR